MPVRGCMSASRCACCDAAVLQLCQLAAHPPAYTVACRRNCAWQYAAWGVAENAKELSNASYVQYSMTACTASLSLA